MTRQLIKNQKAIDFTTSKKIVFKYSNFIKINFVQNRRDTMNKKLRILFSLTLLISKAAFADSGYECESPCEPVCDPCEQPDNIFCGGYIGANFNFGSVNFLSQSSIKTEDDLIDTSGIESQDSITSTTIYKTNRQDCYLREAINAVGGGLTLGWGWANPCWYLAAEFNGLFYGNPNSSLSDCCDDICDTNCCKQYLSTVNSEYSVDGQELTSANRTYSHGYKNNVRLDGVVKVGFLANPNAVLYLLAGGSGLLVQYNNCFNTSYSEAYESQNSVDNTFCCSKWVGGGTFGFGTRLAWCDCLDLVVEARYARYSNTCYSNSKANEIVDDSQEFIFTDEFRDDLSQEDTTKFRADAYLGLIGLNWRF